MDRRFIWLLFFLLLLQLNGYGQMGPAFWPLNHSFTSVVEAEGLQQDKSFHSSIKPIIRVDTAFFVDSLPKFGKKHNSLIYRKVFDEHLIAGKGENWEIQVDPLFRLLAGYDTQKKGAIWNSTRGFQIQGRLGKRIAFYTATYENQAILPTYLDSFTRIQGIIPGQGLARSFGSSGWDFQNATAYISYTPASFLSFQFGHDRHFIGDGYRSLLLSDASFPYPFVSMQTNFGPIHYKYLFAQLSDLKAPPLAYTLGFRQKYLASSYLSWKPGKRWSLGLFQAVIWQADDSSGRRGIDLNYLNPIIFWAPIQFSLGSEGNLLLGLNVKFKINKYSYTYGQIALDEFIFSELLKQRGAAGNKYGLQLGYRHFQFAGLKNLQWLTEMNMVRPYTYSHWSSLTSYTHYNQGLSHPAGANFAEMIQRIDWQSNRFVFGTKLVLAKTGLDQTGQNFGQNIFLDFRNRVGDTGLEIGQGEMRNLTQLGLTAGYILNPKTNLRLNISLNRRHEQYATASKTAYWFYFGLITDLRNIYDDF